MSNVAVALATSGSYFLASSATFANLVTSAEAVFAFSTSALAASAAALAAAAAVFLASRSVASKVSYN